MWNLINWSWKILSAQYKLFSLKNFLIAIFQYQICSPIYFWYQINKEQTFQWRLQFFVKLILHWVHLSWYLNFLCCLPRWNYYQKDMILLNQGDHISKKNKKTLSLETVFHEIEFQWSYSKDYKIGYFKATLFK